MRFWSPRALSCTGIGNSCAVNGLFGARLAAVVQRLMGESASSYSAWPERTHDGAACASRASSPKGIRVSASTIRSLLRRHGLGPAPRREGPTWSAFLKAQARGILALDFFTVESLCLRTFYVLFAIEIASRRVWVLGVSRNPNAAWVTQQARNLSCDLAEAGCAFRFLLRDRDCKYTSGFDQVFAAEGIRVIRTPVQAPKANAFAERWVRTVRTDCLDWMLIGGRRHLEKVLAKYVDHYNAKRPHRGLGLRAPDTREGEPHVASSTASVRRNDVLGGLIHEYELAA